MNDPEALTVLKDMIMQTIKASTDAELLDLIYKILACDSTQQVQN